jgi:multiple sugar transport system substrate-binding protein
LEPLIQSAPYLRALDELIAARKGASGEKRMTSAEGWSEIRAGKAAMAITWAPSGMEKAPAPAASLGFGLLPGASEVFNFSRSKWDVRESTDELHVPLLAVSGRLAAVTTTAADSEAARGFVVWLAGSEVSTAIGPASSATTLFRDSQLASAGRWAGGLDGATAKAYGETLQKSSQLQRFVSLRLPGRDEYLAALDAAVQQSLSGKVTAAEALTAAASKWREITAKIGLERQRRALRRDLGLESLP